MATLDHSLPLQVKAPDMMGMLDQGSQLSQFYTQQKTDGELNRLYKESNGDLAKMMEIGKTSPMARFVMPQLQAQQAAQQKAALDQQKIEADIGKTQSEAFKNNQQGGGFNLDNTAKLMDKANQALYVAAQSGDANAVKLALNNAKSAGLFDSNPEAYNQYFATAEGLSTNPEGLKSFALNLQKAYAQNPEKYNFANAGEILASETSIQNNKRDNTTSENNSVRSTEASKYGTDKNYQLGQQELVVKQKLEQQKINIEQNQGEIVSGSDGMGYIFYKNRPAGSRYEPLLGQDGNPAKAPMTSANKGGMSATAQKELFEVSDSISAATNGIANLRDALKYSAKAYDGVGASQRAAVVGNFKDSEEATATTMLNNIVQGNALEMLKATFGGAPTEGERAILMQLQGSANLPRAQREAIYTRAIQMAERRLQNNEQKAEGIRNGGFFKPGTQQIPASIAKPSGGGKPNALDFFK